MRRLGLLFLLLLLVAPTPAEAGRRSEIQLKVGSPAAEPSRNQVILLGQISDNRHFAERPVEASTPSIAEGGISSTNADQRRFYIARVRDGYGKARNNIFLPPSQPVDAVVRELLSKSLIALGYQVVSDRTQASGNAIVMDVDIDQLWGYIEVQGGGWTGSIPKMAGQIKTTLKVKGPGANTGRYEVSGTALHGFALMTGGHWVKMFEKLFADYQQNLARITF